MTDVTITALPPAPLHALEIWSRPNAVAKRIVKARSLPLPAMGRSAGDKATTLIRFEPTVWLVEGDVKGLETVLGDDGAITAIGGSIVRVELSGPKWRRLLMEGGVFDAEDPAFGPGCSATTIIDHVNVRLHVTSDQSCTAYIPSSFAHDLITFWNHATSALD